MNKTIIDFKNELAVKRGFNDFFTFSLQTCETNPVGIINVEHDAIDLYVKYREERAVIIALKIASKEATIYSWSSYGATNYAVDEDSILNLKKQIINKVNEK